MICLWCDEPILPGERFVDCLSGATHQECMLRQVVGSVAHQMKLCNCFIAGSKAGDPDTVTRREAARVAADLWFRFTQFHLDD